MKGIVFKITLVVSLLVLIAIVLMTYMSGQQITNLFYGYMSEAASINDPYPMIEGGVLVTGPIEKEFLRDIYPQLIWVGVSLTLLAVLLSYIIARGMAIPLRKLIKGVMEIAKGNLDYRVHVRVRGEIGLLAKFFNAMAEELAKAQLLRKQFFADAAHELKTPIAVIKGNLEAMIDGVVPINKETVALLLEETEFLNSMIGDIKYLAMADSGQLILNKKEKNINEIISECLTRVKVAADARQLKINVEFKDDPINAVVDDERLSQAVYNLLINAGKYTPNGGSVDIMTERVSDRGVDFFKITVRDTGEGISGEELPFIFERFYRVDKSRAKKTGGFGLGLAIVKKIIELHDGTIWAESVPKKGSSFYIVAPVK